MEGNHVTGKAMPEASRCVAAVRWGRTMPRCCSRHHCPGLEAQEPAPEPLAKAVARASSSSGSMAGASSPRARGGADRWG